MPGYGSEEVGDLFTLPDPGGVGDYALSMLERVFGGIVGVAMGRDGATIGDNWLNTIIEMFNMMGLFLLMLVALYTALQVVFDTAKDGSVFGKNADSTYTMVRAAAGAAAFIPVSGGFSLVQLALIWLLVQGSALGDEAARRLLINELDGETFIAPTKFESPVDLLVRREFAAAFDGLVRGQLCVDGINSIVSAVSAGENAGPMGVVFTAPSASVTDGSSWGGEYSTATSAVSFTDTGGGESPMGGTHAACGSVTHTATWEYETSEDSASLTGDFWGAVRNQASRARLNAYHTQITRMAAEASAVASGIANNTMSEEEVYRRSAEAVQAGREGFIGGVANAQQSAYSDSQMNEINRRIQDKVSKDGWAMAAAWQRGISLATVEQRANFDDFKIETETGNNIRRILSQNAGLSGSQTRGDVVSELLRDMEGEVELWGRVAPRLMEASLGGSEYEATSLASDGGQSETKGVIGKLMSYIMDMFAVREGSGYTDPMVDVTEFGKGMMLTGGIIVSAGYAAEAGSYFAGGPLAGAVAGEINDQIISPLGWGFLAAGFIAASIIPMLPIVYFLSGVLSWLLLIVETMFAIPLAVLTLFMPARDGSLIGSWNKIFLNVFGIFMRPIFTVAGLFFALVIMAVALDYAYVLFGAMIGMVSANSGSLMSFIMMLGIIVVFVLVSLYIVLLASQLITAIGDAAMGWIGVGMSQLASKMDIGKPVMDASGMQNAPARVQAGAKASARKLGAGAVGSVRGKAQGSNWLSTKDDEGKVIPGAIRRAMLPGK